MERDKIVEDLMALEFKPGDPVIGITDVCGAVADFILAREARILAPLRDAMTLCVTTPRIDYPLLRDAILETLKEAGLT